MAFVCISRVLQKGHRARRSTHLHAPSGVRQETAATVGLTSNWQPSAAIAEMSCYRVRLKAEVQRPIEMSSNAIFVFALFVGAIVVVVVPIEIGYRLGLVAHRRAHQIRKTYLSLRAPYWGFWLSSWPSHSVLLPIALIPALSLYATRRMQSVRHGLAATSCPKPNRMRRRCSYANI